LCTGRACGDRRDDEQRRADAAAPEELGQQAEVKKLRHEYVSPIFAFTSDRRRRISFRNSGACPLDNNDSIRMRPPDKLPQAPKNLSKGKNSRSGPSTHARTSLPVTASALNARVQA
jgi:hypothetical protein